ncbi:PTS mannose/fructose/sorbose/N-acetylgalactosamine transporter subunit IIC [Thermoanaerobacterium thermosaccharolyticum]|uniref:Phosphotransferase system, mannose/fructose/N-acetylgalactosamine-specific component IIC n=1 Tax=Thermoanaerobacterium thermosaccharolyticum M0795 TaxID=698948 RepID=L0IMB6_THETR|nr:PTS sugar transporter subunit IIC [Thermoanaerobacterium thermosaccharolyticum]AGB19361.1 phosphotransferase system, mannose/fructose/N-acetylgalactosamine-specific component IIC [Thermoanaerobacterium thermosaccharolyticum M0795]
MTQVTILQAVLIGCYYWWKNSAYGYSFEGIMMFSPLPAALWAGIVLGNVPEAMAVGAVLQLMYLGTIAPGANLPQDPALAALISTAIVIKTGAPIETAVTMAIPLGLLGAQIWNLNKAINIIWVHMADNYAKKGNIRGIYLSGLLYPTLARIPTHIIPVALAAYYGPTYMKTILAALPTSVMHGLQVIGGMMPAVGFAIVITVIGRKYLLPYFIAGYFIVQYAHLSPIPLAIFGMVIAYMHLMFTNNKNKEEGAING